ncbi:guanine-1-methyltransferase-domain-containing protein [Parachaetomium inaequale]|uniref:tRNA (guanine(9)-N1)-methyltransferase n=1 Tax=Parachaetomium inaequale TaxID=2588326 RepID=A0AAN6SQE0_9PEZI|nr:guanine-1-methyltransferase-domain-containing protein [Parachaetomium inaequale]
MATEEAPHIAADAEMKEAPESTANGKRKADSELERAAKKNTPPSESHEPATTDDAGTTHNDEKAAEDENKPMSKNQLKRLRRQQQWEEFKEDRRSKRKDKRHERQARKRAEKEARIAEAEAAGIDPATVLQPKEPWRYRPVPVAFIVDCDFEQYMREPELVSLSSQLVRSYAMNRKAKYQASLHFSSWKGKLKERFETVLKNAHHNWKNVGFHEGDFKEAAKQAQEQVTGPHGGEVIDLIKPSEGEQGGSSSIGDAGTNLTAEVEPEDEDVERSVVYLTSESPYTLDRLEANTSYVIGGIVDKNREKGLCFKRAKEFKVRTAKLPIGEYMAMQSRYVLTTNQVVEIMAKWLECGDWGQAFVDVIPKRKGGTLKGGHSEGSAPKDGDGEEEDDAAEDVSQEDDTPGDTAALRAEEPTAQGQETS